MTHSTTSYSRLIILILTFLSLSKFSPLAQKVRPHAKSRQQENLKSQDPFKTKISKQNVTICEWAKPKTDIPIYWVNLEHSVQRRRIFEQHLFEVGYHHLRMHALTPGEYDVVLPCYTKSAREIACIISHLATMYKAVYDTSREAAYPYALILEDDVRFQFNIDFDALIKSAPPDFGILQLVTSSEHFSRHLWNQYKKTKQLWSKRNWDDGYWSTQALLINKKNIKNFIDNVVKEEDGVIKFHLMTDLMRKKCLGGCVQPFCLAADTYLYNNGGPTYTTHIPYFNGASIGFNSTIHTRINNAISHEKGFQEINRVVNEVKSGNFPRPDFISAPNCSWKMILQ
eukprot:gene8409-17330_t